MGGEKPEVSNHSFDIGRISVGPGVSENVPDFIADCGQSNQIFLVADNNTYKVLGAKIERLLAKKGLKIGSYIFDDVVPVIPDERSVGRLLIRLDRDASLIVTVGSGTLNDISRVVSHKTGIPYIIVATAPSMDGYASTSSPIIIDGKKTSIFCHSPHMIIADTDILKEAPFVMLQAGFGDIIGKYTSLADWKLANKVKGEYYCDKIADIVRNAIDKCVPNIEGITRRDEEAIRSVTDGLILSGTAMGMAQSTRPASGTEHQLAHYWEGEAISKGLDHPLHGILVGVGTHVASLAYAFLKDRLPAGIEPPSPSFITGLLDRIGAPSGPVDIGMDRQLFYESIMRAAEVRPRYTVLRHAMELGAAEELAEYLTGVFYNAI